MKTILQNRWLVFSLRLILSVIFITASIAKIQDIDVFIGTVTSYDVLPDSLNRIYGYVVPWIELFIGCSLILGVLIRFSATLSILLVISFIVASSYALINTVDGTCGCFGTFLTFSHQVSLIIDVLMLFAGLILLIKRSKEFISVNWLLEGFQIKSRILIYGSRFAVVTLAMAIIALIAIGLHSSEDGVIEAINIPAPLANEVDKAFTMKESVLLEFYAEDCHACEEAEPIINDLELRYGSKSAFIHIDYYQYPQAVSDMNIRTTPTVLVVISKNSGGTYNVLCRYEGVINRESLQTCLENAIER